MNSENIELENDVELVREAIVKPFYWLAIGFTVLMLLPNFYADVPEYDVTFWHVFAAIIVSCVAHVSGKRWVSCRFDQRMRQQYPELLREMQDAKNRTDR